MIRWGEEGLSKVVERWKVPSQKDVKHWGRLVKVGNRNKIDRNGECKKSINY